MIGRRPATTAAHNDGAAPHDRPRSSSAEAAAFRAGVEQRLKSLEADLAEVKSRLNGLLFLAAGAVITQVVLRILRL